MKTESRISILRHSCVLVFLLSLTVTSSSQSDYQSAGTIYKDGYVRVELQFRLNDPCNPGGRKSKFRYVITGSTTGIDKFINWKMDYYNCDNSVTCQSNYLNIGNFPSEGINESIDWNFDGFRLEIPYYDVTISSRPEKRASVVKALPKSIPPKSISGNLSISFGNQTILSVEGGALGSQAEWIWYADGCGTNLVGKGESITVKPITNTRYFVRAESLNGFTDCASAYVEVDPRSTPPTFIEGKRIFCKGEKNIQLLVKGGRLGINADWMWYDDTSDSKKLLEKGPSLSVSPTKNSSYYVRAEGSANITDWRSIEMILVDEKLVDPGDIIGSSFVCQGSSLDLKVANSPPSKSSDWVWYLNSISQNNQIGKGNSITVKPISDSKYLVRGEGVCGNTIENILAITVRINSTEPHDINVPVQSVYAGKKFQLSVVGGTLGTESKWVWYKTNCGSAKQVATGESILTRIRKRTVFYVRAEGACGLTSCANRSLTPLTRYKILNIGIIPAFRSPNGSFLDRVNNEIDRLSDNPVISLTFGQMRKSGWYLRGKYSFKSESAEYTSDNNTIENYLPGSTYYVFNGEVNQKRYGLTGGIILKASNSFLLLIGAGFGQRDLLWGVFEYSNQNNGMTKKAWARNINASYKGPEFELGLMLKLGFINIIAGGNMIVPVPGTNSTGQISNSKPYLDAYVGIGFSF